MLAEDLSRKARSDTDVVDMAGGEKHTLITLSLLKKDCRNRKTRDAVRRKKQSSNVMWNISQR